jgi:hypothetical protein
MDRFGRIVFNAIGGGAFGVGIAWLAFGEKPIAYVIGAVLGALLIVTVVEKTEPIA